VELPRFREAVAAALAFGTAGASAQVAVVVGAKSPVGTMTADQVSAIFLGKSNALPTGNTAVLADLPGEPDVQMRRFP